MDCKVQGFLSITDSDTGEILVDKKNAIHFGNMTPIITEVLSGFMGSHARFMAFGNGATSLASNGEITYKPVNTSKVKSGADALHFEVYNKELCLDGVGIGDGEYDPENAVTTVYSNSDHSDIKYTCTVNLDELSEYQDTYDRADSYDETAIFDELAIYAGPSKINGNPTLLSQSSQHFMLTHVTFHPIQKSKNRNIRIDYVVRITLVPNG